MQKFYKYSILLFALTLFAQPLQSGWIQLIDKNIKVGTTPVGVFYDNNSEIFHVICAGSDLNYNSEFEPDSGDVLPSWWIVRLDFNKLTYTSEKKADFEFGSIPYVTFRPAFVPQERKIYIYQPDGIHAYSLDTYSENSEEYYPYFASGLSYDDGYLIISKSLQIDDLDSILVYDVELQEEVAVYPAGINLLHALTYSPTDKNKIGIAALNLGPYFSDESNVMYDAIALDEVPSFQKISIGNTGNHLSIFHNTIFNRDFLVSTSMFSGAVNIIDPNNDYKKEILTNTSEWEGPSFSKVFEVKKSNNSNNDFLATVNYAGKIEIRQIFVNKAGITTEIIENLIDDIEIGGKSEGFDVVSQNGKFALLATNTLNSDYTPASSVSLISGLIPDDVNESMDNDLLLLPNPSKGILKLHNIELDENNQFVIYNTQGQIVLKKNLSNHLIDISFLENGVYFVCFDQNNKLFYQKIIILK